MGHERDQFETHIQSMFQKVDARPDNDTLELEVVFPRTSTNLIIYFLNPRETDPYRLVCGQPTVSKTGDDDVYVITPQEGAVDTSDVDPRYAHLRNGFDVFVGVPTSGFAPGRTPSFAHNGRAAKVYVAVENNKTNQYHLFCKGPDAKDLTRAYHRLAQTVEEDNAPYVPNYLLKSARDLNKERHGDDGGKVPTMDTFEPVVQQLCKQARSLEQGPARGGATRPSYDFQGTEYKAVFQRFKYLAASDTNVTAVPMTLGVDIMSNSPTIHSRLTMTGKPMFDAFCEAYKRLVPTDEIVRTIQQFPDAYVVVEKRQVGADIDDNRDVIHAGFKLNVKRERPYAEKDVTSELVALLAEGKYDHRYRYKQRRSYLYKGFSLDLTIVRTAERDSKPGGKSPMRPTPFIALNLMRKRSETYELEVERVSPDAQVSDLLWIMDQCTMAMSQYVSYFGKHLEMRAYPRWLDADETKAVTRAFNAMPCHAKRNLPRYTSGESLNDTVGPLVVNITPTKYNYVQHHLDDYLLLTKTDGLRCLALVHKASQTLYLYPQKGRTCMAIGLVGHVSADYVLDGEFYTKDGVPTYYIFDAYAKGDQSLLTLGFRERLAAVDEDLVPAHTALRVVVKTALRVSEYQSLTRKRMSGLELTDTERERMHAFQCRRDGIIADDDGYIAMHTCALVRDVTDEEEEALVKAHGTKPYAMRAAEFARGTEVNEASRKSVATYVLCLKWKPEEECTIDFRVRLLVATGTHRTVELGSKYNTDSPVNMYQMLRGMYGGPASRWAHRSLVPQQERRPVQPFLPSEAYDYQLTKPMYDERGDSVVRLTCDANGQVFTERKEPVRDGDIVEMRYTRATGEWTPARLRSDKTEPNTYRVALDNWRNIFAPVVPPIRWADANVSTYDPSTMKAYYTTNRTTNRTTKQHYSQLDNAHQLLKQHLLFVSSRAWAEKAKQAPLKVYEMGCGKGTDLSHWKYIHQHIRQVGFFLGTDYDVDGLVRHDKGACFRYLTGEGGTRPRVGQPLTRNTRFPFDALFAQADSTRALSVCRETSWSNSDATTRPSDHQLHYQLLRHVLYGVAPEETPLGQVLDDRSVHPVYDIVSSQMAMHYFSHRKSAFWQNLDGLLNTDGLFVATVPNGDFLAERVANGTYTVPIRDAATGNVVTSWYKYEKGSRAHHVFFETPKINRSEEPLFKRAHVTHYEKRYDVILLETFGVFADATGLPCYQHQSQAFATNDIDAATLQHVPTDKTKPFEDTPEALEYSRDGHYVVVLAKKGRTPAERALLRARLHGKR